jgi:hypothetical protein
MDFYRNLRREHDSVVHWAKELKWKDQEHAHPEMMSIARTLDMVVSQYGEDGILHIDAMEVLGRRAMTLFMAHDHSTGAGRGLNPKLMEQAQRGMGAMESVIPPSFVREATRISKFQQSFRGAPAPKKGRPKSQDESSSQESDHAHAQNSKAANASGYLARVKRARAKKSKEAKAKGAAAAVPKPPPKAKGNGGPRNPAPPGAPPQ